MLHVSHVPVGTLLAAVAPWAYDWPESELVGRGAKTSARGRTTAPVVPSTVFTILGASERPALLLEKLGLAMRVGQVLRRLPCPLQFAAAATGRALGCVPLGPSASLRLASDGLAFVAVRLLAARARARHAAVQRRGVVPDPRLLLRAASLLTRRPRRPIVPLAIHRARPSVLALLGLGVRLGTRRARLALAVLHQVAVPGPVAGAARRASADPLVPVAEKARLGASLDVARPHLGQAFVAFLAHAVGVDEDPPGPALGSATARLRALGPWRPLAVDTVPVDKVVAVKERGAGVDVRRRGAWHRWH
mmetsp:Transcript_57241/g.165879  ORF Transcript_57241/g.165879 Transcript_57241/m.165879 type:complete len:306 (-) Transcript_57241:817-1734(-)